VDKAAKKGVITSNTASRKKSRAARLAQKITDHQASTTAATIT
jgi:ribosomal protein S20